MAEPARMVAEMIRVAKRPFFYPIRIVLGRVAMLRDCLRQHSTNAACGEQLDLFRPGERCTPFPKVTVFHIPTASLILTTNWPPGRRRSGCSLRGGEQSSHSSWLHPLLTSTHVLLCAFKETPG